MKPGQWHVSRGKTGMSVASGTVARIESTYATEYTRVHVEKEYPLVEISQRNYQEVESENEATKARARDS